MRQFTSNDTTTIPAKRQSISLTQGLNDEMVDSEAATKLSQGAETGMVLQTTTAHGSCKEQETAVKNSDPALNKLAKCTRVIESHETAGVDSTGLAVKEVMSSCEETLSQEK